MVAAWSRLGSKTSAIATIFAPGTYITFPLRYPHPAFASSWQQETQVLACPSARPHKSDPNPVIRAHHLGRSAVGKGR